MRRSAAIEWLARALAILGGLVLVVITLLIVVSITGRGLVRQGLGPIPGDFELVEVQDSRPGACHCCWVGSKGQLGGPRTNCLEMGARLRAGGWCGWAVHAHGPTDLAQRPTQSPHPQEV